jgi:CheY-like chemotaxis protein
MEKGRIMIVEDIRLIAEDIKVSLTNLGYAVTAVVSSGEEAVQKAAQDRPDLVLMDIVLSGKMDGIETAQQMLSRYNIPVIFLTAYSDEKKLERAKAAEPFGYIVKPYNDRELHATIEMALHKHRKGLKEKGGS